MNNASTIYILGKANKKILRPLSSIIGQITYDFSSANEWQMTHLQEEFKQITSLMQTKLIVVLIQKVIHIWIIPYFYILRCVYKFKTMFRGQGIICFAGGPVFSWIFSSHLIKDTEETQGSCIYIAFLMKILFISGSCWDKLSNKVLLKSYT